MEVAGLPKARAGALPGLVVALAVVVTFWEAIFTSHVFYRRDIGAYWYPYRAVVERAISERTLPLWNPFFGFGVPLLADPNFQLAYPPTWPGLALPPETHYKLFAIGHTLLAIAGVWVLARRLGLGRSAAAFAGGVYALSGPMLSAVDLFHHHVGAAWIPWTLWALEGLLRAPGRKTALVLALVSAAQITAGSGDMGLVAALLGTARAGWFLVRFRTNGPGRVLAVLRYGVLAALLGLMLGAVQWLPTSELARHGFRAVQDPRTSGYWSLHPGSLVDLAVPQAVVELPLSVSARAALFEGREPLLVCVYLGIVPLALAGLALAMRTRPALMAGVGFLFLVTASLGRHAVLFPALRLLPGFGMLRYPAKFLLGAALCGGLLAGVGLESWQRGWSVAEGRRARRLVGVLLACALLAVVAALWLIREPGWFTGRLEADPAALVAACRSFALKLLRSSVLAALVALLLWRRTARLRPTGGASAALLLLAAADLVAVGQGINPLAPAELFSRRPAVTTLLGSGTRIRATAEEGCLTPGHWPADWKASWIAALGDQGTLRPPAGARWGLYGSYDGEFTGLGSRWTATLNWASWRLGGTPPGLRLLQIGAVERVLHVGRSHAPALAPLAILSSSYVCPLAVLAVPEPLPRAYVVRGERQATGPEATLAALLDPAFDPRREVVLESTPGRAPGEATDRDEVRPTARTLDSVELEVRLEEPATLVLVEAFDGGWRAEVDGARAELLRANGLFRAVRLDAGSHRVRFVYRPWAVQAGAALTLAGLLGALALVLLVRRGS